MCWKANSENLAVKFQGLSFFSHLLHGFCSDRFPTFPVWFIRFYEYSNLQTNLSALFPEDDSLVWISQNCLNTISLVINTHSGMGFFNSCIHLILTQLYFRACWLGATFLGHLQCYLLWCHASPRGLEGKGAPSCSVTCFLFSNNLP